MQTKEDRKEKDKIWRLNNQDRIIRNRKRWQSENKDRIRRKGIEYRKLNKERLSEINKIYYQNNQRKALGWNLAKYGLSVEKFEEMSRRQGDVCSICFKKCANKKRLSVDHNHDTGVIRGLLCNNCNRALGLIGDDINFFKNAIKYLNKKIPKNKQIFIRNKK